MSDEIYTYIVWMPPRIKEAVLPCMSGYTIYIADRLARSEQLRAYRHALGHIKKGDWQKHYADKIEYWARYNRRHK